jgi:hypothetical protein
MYMPTLVGLIGLSGVGIGMGPRPFVLVLGGVLVLVRGEGLGSVA